MDALSLLKQQHREVEQLFKELKSAEGAEKGQLFIQLADALATHSTIEERIFYPRAMNDQTEETLQEALQEHLSVKRILADMLDMDPSEERFDAKLSVLEEQVSHHVSEEEDELFKQVAQAFAKDALEELGAEMENLAMMLRESEPRDEIPGEIFEAPDLRQH